MTDGGELTASQLNRTTLLRQSLLERAAEDPATAIQRLCGLQAQNPNSPYVALWSRLRDFRIEDLERALDERTVVKASTIRATLHLVAAEDFPAFNVASSVARVANWRASAERAGLRTADLNRRLLEFAHEPRTIVEMEADLEAIASDASLAPYVPRGVRHVAFQRDSVIIGYEQRDRILPEGLVGQVIQRKNGDFLPSFTIDGLVAGTWSVATEAGTTTVEIRPAARVPARIRNELTEEAERLARFIGRGEGTTGVRWAG